MLSTGDRIRMLRVAKGWSVFDLAHRAGMRENTLRFWEKDERQPSDMVRLKAVANLLGVTPGFLIDGDLVGVDLANVPESLLEAETELRRATA